MPEAQEALLIYPNPSSGVVSIKGLSSTKKYFYKVYTLVGQEVLSGIIDNKSTVNLSRLSSGQYIFVLGDEAGSEVLRARLLVSF